MCEATTIMYGIMAVSAAYGAVKTKQNADDDARFYRKAEAEKQDQLHAQNSVKADQRIKLARAERSRLRALSAETGLSGISTTSLLNNVDFQAGTDVANIEMGQDFDSTNARYGLQSNLNGIEQPDYIGTALNTGLSMYEFNAAYNADTPDSPDPSSVGSNSSGSNDYSAYGAPT